MSDTIETPNFKGLSLFNATQYIQKAGLKLGTILYDEKEFQRNIVFEQSITPGDEVQPGSKIDLKVSGLNPIRFLPSIFQVNDKKNGDFLKRYLWIFQSIINGINVKLDNIHRYFNPLEAPREFFKWLATWFSINLDYEIPEEKMRMLVKEAVNLYRWRGTIVGITKMLEIITGVKPEIIENTVPINEYIISSKDMIERHIVEENTSIYNFSVFFPVKADYFDIETIKKIHQIIKEEKPAHTNYYVVFAKDEKEKQENFSIIGVDRVLE